MKTSISKLMLLALVLIFTKNTYSQLEDSFIIGSGETFETLEEAIDSINIVGVNGLVELKIKAGTYNDYSSISPLIGYSPGDSIAIKPLDGATVKFNHSGSAATNYVLLFDGASHVSVSNLNFAGTIPDNCKMIEMKNGASFNTIDNNIFEAPDGSSLTSAVVIYDGPTGFNEHNNTYSNNTITGGSVGIKISGDAAVHQGPSFVYGNSITGSSYPYGLKMEYMNGGEVKKNYVEGETYLRIDSTFSIIDNHFKSISSENYTLRVFEHDYNVPKGPLLIINNLMEGVSSAFACHISYSNNFKMYHNTIWKNSGVGPQALFVGYMSNVEIMNNIIGHETGEGSVHLRDLGINVTVDYNTYYSQTGFGMFQVTSQTTFSNWKSASGLDVNSTVAMPNFVDSDDFRIKCTSGTAFKSTVIMAEALFDKNGLPRLTVPVWKGAYNAVASDSITIDGFVADGLDTLRHGIVKIYGDMTSKVLLDSIGMSSIGANGYFKFEDVPYLREYWVKVIPDRTLAPEYVTCYQDTSLRWDETDPIVVTDSCDGEQILLVPRKLADKGTGPNKISGTVTDISGSGKTFGTDPIPGLDVVLDRIPPSKTVAFTTTDENGYYEFGDLPDGNYVVSIDYEGLHSDTIYDIIIAGGTVREYLDYCVDTEDRIQGCASGVNTEEVMVNSTTIFPNPFQNEINIQTDLDNYNLMIFNMEGKMINVKNNLSNNQSFSTANLSPGVYLLEVISNGVSKKTSIVKY